MKFARFESDGEAWIGIVSPNQQMIAAVARQITGETDAMIDLIKSPPPTDFDAVFSKSVAEVRLLPPVAAPSKNVICIGKNYVAHAAEFNNSGYDSAMDKKSAGVPKAPVVFSKAAGTMIGAHDDIQPPWQLSSEIDYEAELGVVIGKDGRFIEKENAYDHVFGYTLINDVTARDVQSHHQQWLLGKSIDTFCPVGPWVVSADELDPENLELRCWVNGELRQHANTRDLIFDIPTIIEHVSTSMTLRAGDVIATGTPAGVGIGFAPPRFLQAGDTVKIAIDEIGTIENTLV